VERISSCKDMRHVWPGARDGAREVRIRLTIQFDSKFAPAIRRTNCAGK
jgi:hypothetical protein